MKAASRFLPLSARDGVPPTYAAAEAMTCWRWTSPSSSLSTPVSTPLCALSSSMSRSASSGSSSMTTPTSTLMRVLNPSLRLRNRPEPLAMAARGGGLAQLTRGDDDGRGSGRAMQTRVLRRPGRTVERLVGVGASQADEGEAGGGGPALGDDRPWRAGCGGSGKLRCCKQRCTIQRRLARRRCRVNASGEAETR